ncbi:MAG: four helix bundle protein [Desulfobacteraceae bacterium]|nr:four helix bundle protein [Desulfobacteraceae bacterium]
MNFCYYARGSLNETKSRLLKAVRRGLIMTEYTAIKPIIEVLPKKLNAYINSIRKAQKNEYPILPNRSRYGKVEFLS